MRFGSLLCALGVLVWAASAQANTINFGSISDVSSCTLAGNANDRSCTRGATVSNGANDNTASVNAYGQASADHGLTTNATAIADMTIVFNIPYTVTRTITIPDGPPYPVNAQVPIQNVAFNLTFNGRVGNDNSQVAGGLGQASSFNASITSSSGYFGVQNYATASSRTGGSTGSNVVNITVPDPSYNTSVNFSGAAAGEISFLFQVPTDYRLWSDFTAPTAYDYSNGPHSVVQSFTDTLQLTFRLRAESRPSGSVSTTGGEAIACFGQASPLGSFTIDNGAGYCGTGVTFAATTTVTGTQSVAIPEPSTLALLGAALAGLAWAGARSRRR
jgi:hypothetical protein